MNFLTKLGLYVDTAGGKQRQHAFRSGWPAQTSSEIKFFATNKVQYRYRERGAAVSDPETIVLTADPPVTLELYDELLEIFAKRFRVIVVELPSMGFSAVTPAYGFGFRETNDDFAIFLEKVGGKGAIWAFSCVAGLAAVDLAARKPGLVSRLVLTQTCDVPGFQKWKAARDPKRLLAKPIVGQVLMKRMAPKRMPDWYKLAVGEKSKIEPFCACAKESFSHGALWSLASAYQIYLDPSVRLAAPEQPILSLWGRGDGSHPKENETAATNFSHSVTQVAFDDLGHFAELEDPARIFGVISDYLDEL